MELRSLGKTLTYSQSEVMMVGMVYHESPLGRQKGSRMLGVGKE